MIAQFVDALLQTIREATIEDLRELLLAEPSKGRPVEIARPGPTIRTAGPRIGRLSAMERRTNGPSIDFSSPPSVAEITDPESLLSLGSSSGAQNGAGEARPPSTAQQFWLEPSPATIEGRASRSPRSGGARIELAAERAPAPESTPELDVDGPASNVWPVGGNAPVRLSDNETLARVSNSGIVIRRRKKA